MSYNLFLDDIRIPSNVNYIHPIDLREQYIKDDWIIVRSYNEFFNYIQEKGLPNKISFDHDLALSHYTPEPLWSDYEASKKWQDEQIHEEKTGYECAKWLVDYCRDINKPLPYCIIHSMNPVGSDNIRRELNNYYVEYNNKQLSNE